MTDHTAPCLSHHTHQHSTLPARGGVYTVTYSHAHKPCPPHTSRTLPRPTGVAQRLRNTEVTGCIEEPKRPAETDGKMSGHWQQSGARGKDFASIMQTCSGNVQRITNNSMCDVTDVPCHLSLQWCDCGRGSRDNIMIIWCPLCTPGGRDGSAVSIIGRAV